MAGRKARVAQRDELPLEPLPESDEDPLGDPFIEPLLLRPGSVLVELPALGVLVEELLDPIELPLLDELP
ncbi:hypothetical protein ACPWT1_17035 [Ramlibacter sp. MMS24-I3-19]|uniref:hypothetical protein n=1 Tax=Ramlibacter sp. MMS24-I3-19 TaxID=3416606 RepID=UPI003CFCE2CF